jgi:hypothetical protein
MEFRTTAARAVSNHHQLLFLPKKQKTKKKTHLTTWVLRIAGDSHVIFAAEGVHY